MQSTAARLAVTSAVLVSLQVTPAVATQAAGVRQQYVAMAAFSDGSTQDVSGSVAWTSSDTSRATIDATGLATTLAPGVATIAASQAGVQAPVALTVTAAALVSLQATPAKATVAKGTVEAFAATATYSDGSVRDVSPSVSWNAGDTAVATIGATGLAHGVAAGSAKIAATMGGTTSNDASLTVKAAQLTSIAITPTSVTKGIGAAQQYQAIGTYTDGTTPDVTGSVTWSSSNTSVATISASGLATTVALGSDGITASSGGLQSNTAAPNVGTVTGGTMTTGRFYHSAKLLNDGTVLVAGGFNGSLRSAETYDPATNMFAATGAMVAPHSVGPSVKLPDGRVLVPGGYDGSGPTAPVDLYDPATRWFSAAAPMGTPRYFHTATLLAKGKVLVTGGYDGSALSVAAEIYDPATNAWTPAASLNVARQQHAAVLLPDGKVFVTGGTGAGSPEIFDPVADSWTVVAPTVTRNWVSDTAIVVLANGNVFVAGGGSATSAIYNPAANTWAAMGSTSVSRAVTSETRLPNGKVVLAGGAVSLQVFDPATGLFEATIAMQRSRSYGTATLLNTAACCSPGQLGPDHQRAVLGAVPSAMRTRSAWRLSVGDDPARPRDVGASPSRAGRPQRSPWQSSTTRRRVATRLPP